MKEGMRVRRACPEDAGEIARLEEIAFPMPWSLASIRHDIEENPLAVVLVLERDGAFAGYMDVWRVAGEGQLNNIAVCPEARGLGGGRALMEEMLRILREKGDQELTLEVRESNHPAIRLYEGLGMTATGIREAYYLDNGENAVLMRLDLSSIKE